MTTLILHPGSPKTATSTLQHVLRSNRTMLSAAGVGLILPEDLRGNPYLGRYLAAYRGGTIRDMNQHTADFFGPVLARHDRVICSEETFCHDFMPSRKFGDGGIDRADVTAELLSHSGAARTKVVLSIRPQLDFLISTYTHFVHRHRETLDFPQWLEAQVDLSRMNWAPVVQAFRDRFSSDGVQAVSLAEHPNITAFVVAMMGAFGIGHLPLELSTDQVHNPSPSLRAVHLCRIMNQEITSPKRAETINSALVDTFPVAQFGKFKPTDWSLPPELAAHFASDLASVLAYSPDRPAYRASSRSTWASRLGIRNS